MRPIDAGRLAVLVLILIRREAEGNAGDDGSFFRGGGVGERQQSRVDKQHSTSETDGPSELHFNSFDVSNALTTCQVLRRESS